MNKYTVLVVFAIFSLAGLSGCANKEVLKNPSLTSTVAEKEDASVRRNPEVKKEIVEDRIREAATVADGNTGRGGEKNEEQNAKMLNAALEAIYFNYDSASLSPEARQGIYQNFQLLAQDSKVNLQIEGHCDERGSDEYNLALGENRAKAAMKYLVSLGVAEDRISTISYGKEKPAAEGNDETAWARNRRAEFVVNRTEK